MLNGMGPESFNGLPLIHINKKRKWNLILENISWYIIQSKKFITPKNAEGKLLLKFNEWVIKIINYYLKYLSILLRCCAAKVITPIIYYFKNVASKYISNFIDKLEVTGK